MTAPRGRIPPGLTSDARSKSVLGLLLASWCAGALAGETSLPTQLAGCWESSHGDRRAVEVWFSPGDNRMLGFTETRRGRESLSWEFMRIEVNSRSLSYYAIPSGQEPAVFTQVPGSAGELIFENLQHDFPQRIIYVLPEGDELHARVEGRPAGAETGEVRSIPFSYRRFDCQHLWPPDNP